MSLPYFLPDLVEELNGCLTKDPIVPSTLRRMFLLLIRGHWSDPENFGPGLSDSLKCLHWSPDPGDSTVDIELGGSINQDVGEHVIWITVGNYRFTKVTFGNRADYGEENATEYRTMPCQCQILFRHEAPTVDQAYDMAWTTFCFLLGFTDPILLALGGAAASFTPELIGEPQLKEESPAKRIRVDVGARLDINLTVATVLESHTLKAYSLPLTVT